MIDNQTNRVFISYGRDQYAELAERLKIDLASEGFQVWFDKDKLKHGFDWEEYIEQGLDWLAEDRKNNLLIFLMTPHSVRRPDGFCLNELAKAILKNITILPVMVVPCEPPLSICRLQWFDMLDCFPLNLRLETYRNKFEKLLSGLNTRSFEFEDGQKDLLRLLEPVDNGLEILRHLNKFSGRTWLMEIINNWFQNAGNHKKIFWITGLPGIGKSAISAWLCENQRQISAVHFCEFGNREKTDLVRMIKSMAYQLSTQLPDYAHILKTIDLRDMFKSFSDPKTIFNTLIVRPLNNISAPGHALAILIDALDEATKDGKNELAELIVTEFEKTPPWLKLVITSRPDPEVMVPMQKLSPFVIDASCKDNTIDIKNYLNLELSPLLEKFSPARRKEIIEKISLKSEGIFLYVKSVCEELKSGSLKLADIDQFPSTLGTIYNIFFQREFPDIAHYKQNTREAISLIISSYEPVKIRFFKDLLGWSDLDFNDFILSLGSLFIIKKIDQEDAICVYHLSLIDWITDRLKAGDFCVPLADGRMKFLQAGWEQYEKFRTNSKNIPDPYFVKWLPAILIDNNRYEQALALLTDENYTNLKINNNYDEILFQDFRGLFYLADKSKDIEHYHKILIHNIKAHVRINNTTIVKFEARLKEGAYESMLQAIDLTDHFKGRELFLSYMILLIHLINSRYLNDQERTGLIGIVLKNVARHFLSDTRFNALDHLPKNLIDNICYKLELLGIPAKVIRACCDNNSDRRGESNMHWFTENHNANNLNNIEFEKNYRVFLKVLGEPLLYILLNSIYFFNYALNFVTSSLLGYPIIASIFITYLIQVVVKRESFSRQHLSGLIRRFEYPRIIQLFFRTSGRIGITYKRFLKKRDLRNYKPAKNIFISRLLIGFILSKRERINFRAKLLLVRRFRLTEQQIRKEITSLLKALDRLNDKYYVRYDKIEIVKALTNLFIKNGFDQFAVHLYEKRLDYINQIGLKQFREHHRKLLLEDIAPYQVDNELLIMVILSGFRMPELLNDKFMKLLAITNFKEYYLNFKGIDHMQDKLIDSIEDRAWVRNFPDKFEVFSTTPDWSLVFPITGGLYGYKSYEALNCFIDNYEGIRAEDASLYFPELGGLYTGGESVKQAELDIERSVFDYLYFESKVHETIAQSRALIEQSLDPIKKNKALEELACAYAASGMVGEVEKCLALFTDKIHYSKAACMVSEILRKKDNQELSEKYLNIAYNSTLEIKFDKTVKKQVLKYYMIRMINQDTQESIRLLLQFNEHKLIDLGDRNEILELIYKQLIKYKEETKIQELINIFPGSMEVLKRIILYEFTEEVSQELTDQCQVFNKFFFRKIHQVEQNIFGFTAEKVADLEYLLNIIYRYSAYMAFVSKRDSDFRKNALKGMNEVIVIDDWVKAMNKKN